MIGLITCKRYDNEYLYRKKEAEAIKFVNSLLNTCIARKMKKANSNGKAFITIRYIDIGIPFMAYNEKKCYLCAFKKVLCNKGYTAEEVYHNTCDNGVMITW